MSFKAHHSVPLWLALTTLVSPLCAAAAPPRLTLDDLFDDARTGARPSQLVWHPDSRAVTFVWDGGDGKALHRFEAESGQSLVLLRPSELPGGSGEDRAIDAYQWSEDGTRMLVESSGDLYLWQAGAKVKRLTTTGDEEEGAKLSPDGHHVAYSRAANLYVRDVRGLRQDGERQLTRDGKPGEILNGITDWVYWEEIWDRSTAGIWWSPQSTHLAYYHFDDTAVGEYSLIDELPQYPTVKRQRYPKAGTTNPKVKLGVLALATGQTVWLDTGHEADGYLVRVYWRPDGQALAVLRLNREQDALDVLSCQPTTGACKVLLEERWPTWVNLEDHFRYLKDGRFLWGSDRDGWRHLYLVSADGKQIDQLTSGAWNVTAVEHVDEAAGSLMATSFGHKALGAAERIAIRVSLTPGREVEVLTPGDGWHSVTVSPDGRRWVHGWSDADNPGWQRVETVTGAVLANLPAKPAAYDPARLPKWYVFALEAPNGGRLPARVLLPPAPPPEGQRFPALMYHYGGPRSQVVVNRWDDRRNLWHKMMAQRGYVILMVDNLSSLFFGKRGEDRDFRRFGEVNLAAQLAGHAYLHEHPLVDGNRIGLWGWSGGGTNTLYCVLQRPGSWKAAVAGAPVTDWKLYDSIWTERYLDHPDKNPEGYRLSSPVTWAAQLKDSLLIVHGTADDNVHPQNTTVMADRWVNAGVPFEMAIYPKQKHGLTGKASRHFYARITAYFDRELTPPFP